MKMGSILALSNRVTACFLCVLFGLSVAAQAAAAAPDIEALLAKMSTREKLGQLSQYAGGRSKNLNSKIDDAELDRVRMGLVGSYLHVSGAAFLADVQRTAVEESPNGVPILFAMDVVHGYRTIFPVPLAIASSWDESVAEEMAQISAIEASASGIHWTFAPMIDIARDARWGRIVEGAGSDPYLGSAMAIAQINGYQGGDLSAPDTILATAKHLGAYGAAIGGRDYNSADISERTLNEIYLPPFYAAANANVGSFMTAFNDIAGIPTTANEGLLRNQVREGWGWNGLIVSDWNAIEELINHGVAANRADAGAMALNATVDMEMTSGIYGSEMVARVEGDQRLMQNLDDAVRRVLNAKAQLGLFDNPYQYHDASRETAQHLSEAHRLSARHAAIQSMVLLKNQEDLLPLQKTTKRIAVIGPLADDALSQLGSWRARGEADDVTTLIDALNAQYPNKHIEIVEGLDDGVADKASLARAKRAAARADIVLLTIGEDYDLSGEARSRSDIGLPPEQKKLFDAIASINKPIVTILMNGRPLAIPEVAERSEAILETWFLGVESGSAIVDVLFGDAVPGGKLPIAFPRVTGQTPKYYNHRNTGRPADPDLSKDTARYHDLPITPLFPFGHGLSYTTFEYGGLAVSDKKPGSGRRRRHFFFCHQ